MKGVDGSGGRGRLQLPREKEAAAATAATGPDGERAACFLRRTKIMEFSGTTQNTPQGGTSKIKKGHYIIFFCALSTQTNSVDFCGLLLYRRFFPVSVIRTHTLSLMPSLFSSRSCLSLRRLFSLTLIPSSHGITGRLPFRFDGGQAKIQADLHMGSLLFFFIWFWDPLGFAPCSDLLPSCSIPSRLRAV